ncbi:HAD family hydrolase [Microbacterium murale]|uniref:HAD superfamily hydrolase (TIGR01509 family) n=1 Tax=Microbacterium murale TaxID=1081040 RepID=A0ABU0PAG5_9MICO|nr:HAD family phosphatase [Microbacterium murale]MDQ0644326.1 HAD superfamily hydrolase (TIGR01509 family) [Microbacterium murale]
MSNPRAHARRLPAAVLWDMDGTIVDTERHWIAAAERMLAETGLAAPENALGRLVGLALPDGARVIHELGGTGSGDALLDRWIELATARTRTEGITWRPGARSLLRTLSNARVPLALVTMSYRDYADEILAALPSGTFDVTVTGDEVAHGKPSPDAYLRAAELLGVDPADCVAIEDSPVGLAAARAAGAATVGVPHDVPLAEDAADLLWPSLRGRGLHDLRIPLGEEGAGNEESPTAFATGDSHNVRPKA